LLGLWIGRRQVSCTAEHPVYLLCMMKLEQK
jgi:hypothetical protein